MSLRAIVINETTIDYIEQINGGVRPEFENELTYYVYSDDFRDDFTHEILSRYGFEAKYRWGNPFGKNNIVTKK